MDGFMSLFHRVTSHTELLWRPVCEGPGGGRVASPHCFNPGARGHAQMLFVSVCVSVGGLNFDPTYV